jgi:hypothetical protein
MLSQVKSWKKDIRSLIDVQIDENNTLNNIHYRELASLNLEVAPYKSCFLKKDAEDNDIVDENKPDSKCDLYKQIMSYRTTKANKNEKFSIDLFVANTQPRQSIKEKDELISQLRLELQREKDSNREKDGLISELRLELDQALLEVADKE